MATVMKLIAFNPIRTIGMLLIDIHFIIYVSRIVKMELYTLKPNEGQIIVLLAKFMLSTSSLAWVSNL